MIVAVSVITTFTTPYFIRMADPAYEIVARMLPERLHFLLNRYTDKATSESETKALWVSMIKRYLWRVLLYSAVIIAIILVCTKYLLPWLMEVTPSWGRIICSIATLVCMSPFLLALTSPVSRKKERQRLAATNAHFDVPIVVMTIFRVLMAVGFIVYALSYIHSMKVGWTVGFFVFFALIGTWSGRLKKQMGRIESRFFNNLNERELRRSGKNNNLVSDMHLAYLDVSYSCPFVGERLADSDLRRKYGINVASIQRGGATIAVPNGNMRLFPGDVIGVIGTDEQIEQLLPVMETDDSAAPASNNGEIKFTNIHLSATSPLVGQTSASARIRDKYQALLVAIQHADGSYDHPTGNMEFQVDDVLWVVGNPKILATLK
jgi:CPA2 family monovalent cation:H+ antiporter-2